MRDVGTFKFLNPQNLAHRLGDRLIPLVSPFEVSWILHVGPTKNLTSNKGPKGCHENHWEVEVSFCS